MNKKILFLLFFSTLFIANSQTTRIVNSQGSFSSALLTSVAGDIIEWEDGTYGDVFMDITKSDITVKAETSGGVTFNGSSRVEIDGDNVELNGFQFIGGDILDETAGEIDNTIITIDGSYVTVSNVNFSEYTCWKYLRIRNVSQYTEITYCNFENRLNYANKNILQVDISETQSGFHNINHCSFKNFTGVSTGGDDGVEPIRIGASNQSTYSSKSVVEYCYFTQCSGDGEIISHKGTDCIYRYNTFEDNPIGELVLRHGDEAVVYGNFFLNNKGGVRVQEGTGHVIYNNYFNNQSDRSVYLSNDDSDPVENTLIAYNTFANTKKLDLSGGSNVQVPTNITIANNIFSNTGSDNVIDDETGTETWIGNIYNGNIGIALPSTGLSNTNANLSLNTEGFYAIVASSPAINKGKTGYPALPVFTGLAYDNTILLDALESARPSTESMKDIGCQEYDASATLKAHVTEANTGPNYLIDTSLSTSNEIIITDNFTVYPNPLVGDTINIDFYIEQKSDVKVDLYDLSGKKIVKLIEASYNVGQHNFNSVIKLNAGLYILCVEVSTGNTLATKIEKIVKE